MPTQRHAAARAPRSAQEQPATLLQLKDLVGQMDAHKISRTYMQDFLRHKLVRPEEVVENPHSALVNKLQLEVEDIVREHYPEAAAEIMELVAPFCDPAFSLEFRPMLRSHVPPLLGSVREALFWLDLEEVKVVTISAGRRLMSDKDVIGDGVQYRDIVDMREWVAKMFAKEFETYKHLDSQFDIGSAKIMFMLYHHLTDAMHSTGAVRYHLIADRVEGAVVGSIYEALRKAIVLLGRGDQVRVKRILPFIACQRSGNPIVCYHDRTAYVLEAPPR